MRTALAVASVALVGCSPPEGSLTSGVAEPVVISSKISTAEDVAVQKKVVVTQNRRDCFIRNEASELTIRASRIGSSDTDWYYQVQDETYPGSKIFVSIGGKVVSGAKNEAPATSLKALRVIGNEPLITYSYTEWPHGNIKEATTTFRGLTKAVDECAAHMAER